LTNSKLLLKTQDTFDRNAFSKYMKKGITPLLENSGLKHPSSQKFKCILGEFNSIPDEKTIEALSITDCVIKSES